MFAYMKIFDTNSSAKGYVNFAFLKGKLLINQLRGSLPQQITIPISDIQITNEDFYDGWNRVHFNYNGHEYLFIYSAYGYSNYFKENLMSVES